MNAAPLPPQLRVMMQVCATGRLDTDLLNVLREDAPRFVDMIRNGLNTDMTTLRRMAADGVLTVDKIAEAMR